MRLRPPVTDKACGGQLSAPTRGQNGARRRVRPELVGAVDDEQLREPRACTINPALDRPYRGPTNLGGLVVGEARRVCIHMQSLAM